MKVLRGSAGTGHRSGASGSKPSVQAPKPRIDPAVVAPIAEAWPLLLLVGSVAPDRADRAADRGPGDAVASHVAGDGSGRAVLEAAAWLGFGRCGDERPDGETKHNQDGDFSKPHGASLRTFSRHDNVLRARRFGGRRLRKARRISILRI
jgi:hypothetical protein